MGWMLRLHHSLWGIVLHFKYLRAIKSFNWNTQSKVKKIRRSIMKYINWDANSKYFKMKHGAQMQNLVFPILNGWSWVNSIGFSLCLTIYRVTPICFGVNFLQLIQFISALFQVPYAQIRENNWTLNADFNGRWNLRFDLWEVKVRILFWKVDTFVSAKHVFYLLVLRATLLKFVSEKWICHISWPLLIPFSHVIDNYNSTMPWMQ